MSEPEAKSEVKPEQDSKPEGLSFIAKLIIGKLVLIAIVGVVVYFSLQNI